MREKKVHVYLPNVSIDAEPVILPIPILLPELFKLLSLSLLEAVEMTRKKENYECNRCIAIIDE